MTPAPAGEAVLDLAAIRASDASRVGPKMARLGQLASTGWRVPDGYAVTDGTFLYDGAVAEDFNPALDSNYRGDFEYGVRVYNADGDEIVNSVSKTVSPILPPAVYKSMLTGGANAHQEIDVPATGDYFLRIAVHDLTTGRIGAIEIPTSSIN